MFFLTLLVSILLLGESLASTITEIPPGGVPSSAHFEFLDSNNVTLMLFYGNSRMDSVAYPLSEAEKVLDDPHFNRYKTVFYIEDYHEPQFAGYPQYIMVDAYTNADFCNFLALDWGTGYLPLGKIKDPDLDTLVPWVTDFLIQLHDRTDWQNFSAVGYARGVEFMHYVVKDLYEKMGIRIPRVTQLAPQTYYMTETDKGEIIPNFVDIIHTDLGNHEHMVSRGHAEFFPNGGVCEQPGCPEGCGSLDVCSRQRSKLLWGETLLRPYDMCGFSYEDFRTGEYVEDEEVPMGSSCPTWTRGKFVLDTAGEPPYGVGCPSMD